MDDRFRWRASQQSDQELHNRIDNREKYLPETVEAAVEELKFRGETFSDEELEVIAQDMQARRDMAKTPPGYDTLFNDSEKIKQVEDPDAPAFYTKRVIYIFSILFSVLFGSILFAINVGKTPKKLNVVWIVFYGLAFTVVQSLVAQRLNASLPIAVIGGIVGSYPLNYFFWGKFLGNETLYRARPIWVPLLIAVALSALVVYMIVSGNMVGV